MKNLESNNLANNHVELNNLMHAKSPRMNGINWVFVILFSTLFFSTQGFSQTEAKTEPPQKQDSPKVSVAVESTYSVMGKYQGQRTDDDQRNLTLNFQKYDFTGKGVRLFFRAEPKKDEKPVKADHFIWEVSLSLEDYKKIFQSDEKIENLSVGPDHEPNPNDLYTIVVLNAGNDPKTGMRHLEFSQTTGDYGRVTRKYSTKFGLKNGSIVFVKHEKKLKKRFSIIGDGYDLVASFESLNLAKTADGLELMEYNVRLKKPENIESAANDSSPANFERLAELEREEPQSKKTEDK